MDTTQQSFFLKIVIYDKVNLQSLIRGLDNLMCPLFCEVGFERNKCNKMSNNYGAYFMNDVVLNALQSKEGRRSHSLRGRQFKCDD